MTEGRELQGQLSRRRLCFQEGHSVGAGGGQACREVAVLRPGAHARSTSGWPGGGETGGPGAQVGRSCFLHAAWEAPPTGLAMTATGPGSAERLPPRGPQPRLGKADQSLRQHLENIKSHHRHSVNGREGTQRVKSIVRIQLPLRSRATPRSSCLPCGPADTRVPV